ncbi:MAG: Ig-like domain-containing protein [Angelakisella sp.]
MGQKYTLIATILPENATNKSVTWSSNAPDIVEVTAAVER